MSTENAKAKPFDPARAIQDFLAFGEFGDVNPSVCDSSTYTFMSVEKMEELFEHEVEGCFLYSRHWNPTNRCLSDALARMEDGECAQVTASGMAAISSTLLALCSAGDEIVSGRTIYGGTYALLKNLLPRFGVTTRFVDLRDLKAVRDACTPRTRVVYGESISNPLLEVADLPALADIAHHAGARLVVDNTFAPLILSPLRHGADIVVHSLTKFINGTSDCVAGAAIGSHEIVGRLNDINQGPTMLLGPVLDSIRAAGILKNLHSLPARMERHSRNALYLAERFRERGLVVHYPGLPSHPQHALLDRLRNEGFGYGGILALDMGNSEAAALLMRRMQEMRVGYLAVSLGYFKTLFSPPGHSTSSEIPEAERHRMGMGDGLIRFSVGLDQDMGRTWESIAACLDEVAGKSVHVARAPQLAELSA